MIRFLPSSKRWSDGYSLVKGLGLTLLLCLLASQMVRAGDLSSREQVDRFLREHIKSFEDPEADPLKNLHPDAVMAFP